MDDLHRWVTWGLIALQTAMIGVVIYGLRLKTARRGLEVSIMLMAALALGPAGSLFRQARRFQSLAYEPFDAYVNLGFLVFVSQVIFWAAFYQLRARDRAGAVI